VEVHELGGPSDGGQSTVCDCAIQFGESDSGVYSPILISLTVYARDPEERAALEAVCQGAIDGGALRRDEVIVTKAKDLKKAKQFALVVSEKLPWTKAEELDEPCAARVAGQLRRLRDAFVPRLMQRDGHAAAPPGVVRFLRKMKSILDEEMEETWLVTKYARKRVGYGQVYGEDEQDSVEAVIWMGGDTGSNWQPLRVGLEMTTEAPDDRDGYKQLFLDARDALPVGTSVEPLGSRTVRALLSLPWREERDLDDALAERAAAAFRQIRDALEPLIEAKERS
jgi:hypothetical protein